ncbi:hypothetical protein [Kitasatospora camelliae]|uniref:PQ loop repeat protein n=1 Tax=Kitasatospora camelliae TaxID=3156397 RepID=A0AAU8K6K1_9ACTN
MINDMDCAQLANFGASGLVTLTSAVAVATYHRLAPWRSTRYGRHVMTVTAAVGALGLYTVLITLWPTGVTATILRGIRTGLLLLLAVMMIQRTRMFIDAQHRPPRDEQPK